MISENDKGVTKLSVTLYGHRTSISLEEPFLLALKEIARAHNIGLAALIAQIDQERINKTRYSLSSALRVFVIEQLSARIEQDKE